MLIWINGAFGAGKTQTAFEVQRRLANAHVADPELPGFALHRMLPKSARADFQDLPEWRTTVVAALRRADAVHDGPVLVPRTIVRNDYFDEIVEAIARDAGLALVRPRLSPLRYQLRRISVGVRHIRFD